MYLKCETDPLKADKAPVSTANMKGKGTKNKLNKNRTCGVINKYLARKIYDPQYQSMKFTKINKKQHITQQQYHILSITWWSYLDNPSLAW